MGRWGWYLHRLRAMSLREVAWRISQKCLERRERKYARHPIPVTNQVFNQSLAPLTLDAHKLGIEYHNEGHCHQNDIHLLGGFDYSRYKTRWHAGFQTPNEWGLFFSYDINYKQHDAIGDARTNWELNRHFQFALLAKNYYHTHDRQYLEELTALLDDWRKSNPFLLGISWTSVMEVAIRSINWMFMLAYLKKAGDTSHQLQNDINTGIVNMLDYVNKHRSRYSSANNHLLIESTALVLGGYAFGHAPWKEDGIRTMTAELERQITPDGVNREMSLHYHAFVLEAYSLTAHCILSNSDALPPSWHTYMERMSEFICHSMYDEAHVLAFGDDDEGKVIDLQGGNFPYYDYVLQMSSLVTGKRYSHFVKTNETVNCLFPASDISAISRQPRFEPYEGKCFEQGGYTFLRSKDGEVLIGIDHAPLGFGSIAAHGHADALSFQLLVGGAPLFTDPGTYIYHCDLPARNQFRKTLNHSTVSVGGADQSEMLGAFLWGKKANCRLLRHDINDSHSHLTAEHDGYAPVTVRRTFDFDHEGKRLTITDELSQESDIILTYTTGHGVDIQQENKGWLLSLEKARCLLTISVPSQYAASAEPTEVSVCYGTKSSAKAIRYRTHCKSITSIITIL